MGANQNSDLLQSFKLIGYPGAKSGQLYESSGPPFEILEKVLSYKINTSTGQSGSPLIMKINDEEIIIGLHQSSDIVIKEYNGKKLEEYTNKNWGTRITPEIIKTFEKITRIFVEKDTYFKNAIVIGLGQFSNTQIKKNLIEKDKKEDREFSGKKWKFLGSIDKNGIKQGYGILQMDNGDLYKGEFKGDKYHGKGVYFSENGDIFDGIIFYSDSL
jgi:hypothetical protein